MRYAYDSEVRTASRTTLGTSHLLRAFRRLAHSARLALVACAAALVGACVYERTPAEFEPIAASATVAGMSGCPDLTGTFDLVGTSLAAIAGRKPPDTYELPVRMTFTTGPTNIEGWWVVPRERLVAFAKAMSEDTPQRYVRWRELVLKEHLPETLRQDFDAYQQAVAELGPPGPVFALVFGSRCERNWMRVADWTEHAQAGDEATHDEEREIWLARDASGALLAKHVAYTLWHYSIWAPSTQSIRTSRRTRYERVPPAEPVSAAPLVAADLPADPLTHPRAPIPCAEVPARIEQFSQRLRELLSPKSQLTRFAPKSVRQQDADGNCPFASIDVEISGGDSYFLSRTETWLRAEPNVESVEPLPAKAGQSSGTTLRLRVVLY